MVVAALLVVTLASPAGSVERAGITAPVPAGWHIVDKRLTPCTNPRERLTLAGPDGAMVMLQESLDPRRYIARFNPRPTRWHLRGQPRPIACCAPAWRAGWFIASWRYATPTARGPRAMQPRLWIGYGAGA